MDQEISKLKKIVEEQVNIKLHTLAECWRNEVFLPTRDALFSRVYFNAGYGALGSMNLHGQILMVGAGWSLERLIYAERTFHDTAEAVAMTLDISEYHARLIERANFYHRDRMAGIFSPEAILGQNWRRVLQFWHYVDHNKLHEWRNRTVEAKQAEAVSNAARSAIGETNWEIVRQAAGGFIRHETAEIISGQYFGFLTAYAFGDIEHIPPLPDYYGRKIVAC